MMANLTEQKLKDMKPRRRCLKMKPETKIMAEEELNCFIDGDNLCIVKKGFVNLQESPAYFIYLSPEVKKDFDDFIYKEE